jgi:hypothetical protein
VRINYLNMKRLLLLITICISSFSFGQRIVRSTIGAIGSSSNQNGIIIQQSVGQPALTSNDKSENGMGLRQGFIQPVWFETVSNDLNVILYPNPNQGDFSFQADIEEDVTYDYKILDQQGKLVLVGKGLGNELVNVSIDNPARGMYHLNVKTEDKTSAFKINVIY